MAKAPGIHLTPVDSTWVMEPSGGKFLGLMTKDDPSKIPDGATPTAINVYHNTGDRVSVRPFGYLQFPSTDPLRAALPGVGSFKILYRRDGTPVPMYAWDVNLYFFDVFSKAWNLLKNGWNSSDFGFAEFNVNTDQTSKFYFGNAVDNFSYWPSDIGYLTAPLLAGAVTINVDTTAGFPNATEVAQLDVAPTAAGVGYAVNDVVTINGGTSLAQVLVTKISGGGSVGPVTQVALIDGGSGYTVGVGKVITGGTGAGLTVSILVIGSATPLLYIGGAPVTYTGKTATSFTGAVGTPASASLLPVWQGVVQDATAPKGNIYLASDNRLFISGVLLQPQAIYFSVYADASSWGSTIVTAATATSAGVFNLVEGGGPVTAMVQDEKVNYFFKKNVVYAATLTDSLYSLDTLKPYDGKSQLSGAATKRSVTVSSNKVIFVTEDHQIMSLQRLAYLDYPQSAPVSYPIQPSAASFDYSKTAAINFKDLTYIACKSDSTVPFNDLVLIWNHVENIWEGIVEGWHVTDWGIFDDGTGQKLYFGDASAQNIMQVVNTPTDGPYPVAAQWFSKQFDFGTPSLEKDLFAVYVEGYIVGNTQMTVQLLLDEGGFTTKRTTIVSGSDQAILFTAPVYNWFGAVPFGQLPFGSNPQNDGRRKFRVYLNIGVTSVPFYNCQVSFSSDGSNEYWEVLRFGFLVRQDTQPMRPTLYHTF